MSEIIKRTNSLCGHRTSVSLENEFWDALKEIAKGRKTTRIDIIREIDRKRATSNLSSAIRVYILNFTDETYTKLRHLRCLGSARWQFTACNVAIDSK